MKSSSKTCCNCGDGLLGLGPYCEYCSVEAATELLHDTQKLRERVAELEAEAKESNAHTVALLTAMHVAIEDLAQGGTFSPTNAWSVLDEALGLSPNSLRSSKSSQSDETQLGREAARNARRRGTPGQIAPGILTPPRPTPGPGTTTES